MERTSTSALSTVVAATAVSDFFFCECKYKQIKREVNSYIA